MFYIFPIFGIFSLKISCCIGRTKILVPFAKLGAVFRIPKGRICPIL